MTCFKQYFEKELSGHNYGMILSSLMILQNNNFINGFLNLVNVYKMISIDYLQPSYPPISTPLIQEAEEEAKEWIQNPQYQGNVDKYHRSFYLEVYGEYRVRKYRKCSYLSP